MSRHCTICESNLHNTSIHRYWKEKDKPHSCLTSPLVLELREAAKETYDDIALICATFSHELPKPAVRLRKALAAVEEG